MRNFGPKGKTMTHLYGRPLEVLSSSLQKLNLAAAWSRVKVPALILHGQYDWIMSREDSELIAQIRERKRSRCGTFHRSAGDGPRLSALFEYG